MRTGFRKFSPEQWERTDLARLAGAELVYAVTEDQSYANLLLGTVLDKKKLRSIDRSFATAIGYGTITFLVNIDAILTAVSDKPLEKLDPPARAILRSAVWQIFWSESIPDYAVCDESVKIADLLVNKGAGKYINGVLRRIINQRELLWEKYFSRPGPFYLRCHMPPELAGYFKKWFGVDRAVSIARAMTNHRRMAIRINPLRCGMTDLATTLAQAGLSVQNAKYIEYALYLKTGGIPAEQIPSYTAGRFSIQDESAMLVSVIANPTPGITAADLCAAPGGKTCHIAELMMNAGIVYATDIHESRLRLVEENADRLGIKIIHTSVKDWSDRSMKWDKELCDLVLADVPCSGLGILHKKPDIRLHMNHEKIIGLYTIQKNILRNAAKIVKAGGVLVYSTCTLNPMENQERIRDFLENDEEGRAFVLEDFSERIPYPLQLKDPLLAADAKNGMITLFPDIHDIDGFFIAKLRKKWPA